MSKPLFDTDGSVIPNVPLAEYQMTLRPTLKHQTLQSAVITFLAEPDHHMSTARRIARMLRPLEIDEVTLMRPAARQ